LTDNSDSLKVWTSGAAWLYGGQYKGWKYTPSPEVLITEVKFDWESHSEFHWGYESSKPPGLKNLVLEVLDADGTVLFQGVNGKGTETLVLDKPTSSITFRLRFDYYPGMGGSVTGNMTVDNVRLIVERIE